MSGIVGIGPEPERRIPVNVVCLDLIPGHRLRVTHLIEVLRMRYTITPALPTRDSSEYASPLYCWWEATDDRGTRYSEGGGAFGPTRDGQRTEGVFSLTPLPPFDARELQVVLHMDRAALSGECAFTVDLTTLS